MMPDALQAALTFNRTLTEGSPAEVRWTSCGRQYRAVGTVAKVNAKSVRVAIADAIYEPHYVKPRLDILEQNRASCGFCTTLQQTNPGEWCDAHSVEPMGTWERGNLLYPAGHEIMVPRCVFGALERWSVNNGVFPPGWSE